MLLKPSTSISLEANSSTFQIWHARLGHVNSCLVNRTIRLNQLSCRSFSKVSCNACHLGKMHKLPFLDSYSPVNKSLELICSDVWGPSPISSIDGFHFYVLFYDHYNKYSWSFFMKNKSDVLPIFIEFHSLVEKFFDLPIKSFQTDWDGEF